MRPIKFRVRDLITKKVLGYEHLIENQWDYQGTGENHTHSKWHTNTVVRSKKAIREQFTGLHDKNGKEIYEGDIVKRYGVEEPLVIYWEAPGFIAQPTRRIGYYYFDTPEELEIIGNIHENPELLNNVGDSQQPEGMKNAA